MHSSGFRLRVSAAGHHSTAKTKCASRSAVGCVRAKLTTETETKASDFASELTKRAMRLHSKDQAKSGGQKASPKPVQKWVFTREGYLRFLVESSVVYTAFEEITQTNDAYALFKNSELDRVADLKQDIEWISSEYGLSVPSLTEDSPGGCYAKLLKEMSETNPPAFFCHFYTFYLAHTAGGRMIGKKVADSVFSGAFDRMGFYQYASNVKTLVHSFKSSINTVTSEWTEAEKESCLDETEVSFKYAGSIMGTMFTEEEA